VAIDINPFENPYVSASDTVYPDTYFLEHRRAPGTFTSATSPAVRAFTDQGFTWGGTWAQPDLQHFQLPRQVP